VYVFTNAIYIVQLAAGMIFGCYLMINGFGDYVDKLPELARAKMLIGVTVSAFSVISARFQLLEEMAMLKPILFPLTYAMLCLGLNWLTGEPFNQWPSLVGLF